MDVGLSRSAGSKPPEPDRLRPISPALCWAPNQGRFFESTISNQWMIFFPVEGLFDPHLPSTM